MTKNSNYKQSYDGRKGFKKREKALLDEIERRKSFEKLFADISATFVNIPTMDVDGQIEGVLKRFGEVLNLDRCAFLEYGKEEGVMKVTHVWSSDDQEYLPDGIQLLDGHPYLKKMCFLGENIVIKNPEDFPDEAFEDKKYFKARGQKSALMIPYIIDGSFLFAITFGDYHAERSWPEDLIRRLRLLGEIIYNALLRMRADLELQKAFTEIKELKEQLQEENIFLRKEIRTVQRHPEILGESEAIQKVLRKTEQVAQTDSIVFISGETGTGKELIARAIHNQSSRKDNAMVTVNCAALPATLVESELFGREKGAYTGAMSRQVGRFEMAHGSTLFLDEIGELPFELQVKLLRVLQEGQFERLGSNKTIKVDVRVIAATNRDLEKAIQEGRFREDLYYRLNVFPIYVPPLRERQDDIDPLTWFFVKEFDSTMGKQIKRISRRDMESMLNYPWPGNIRELKNLIERAMIESPGETLKLEVPCSANNALSTSMTLEMIERQHILDILEKTSWRIRGKTGAAEILGLNPSTLYARLKKLGINRPKNPSIY